ncbi:RNA ligase partner protein [Candidatus Roizmanbacteria bacterium]|nr:RNA ligase partner protein [Candidatus Roizmanbacteria bacterium]
MERYVLDTNLFFNMEGGLGIGKTTEDVVIVLTKAIRTVKANRQVEFLMPPRIIDEFLSFFEDKSQGFIRDFLSTITVKSPDLHTAQLSAAIVWQIIDDVRNRNYRGQTIAEEEIVQAAKQMAQQSLSDKKQFEMVLGPVVKRFRMRYRQATRFGFLDSVADLELIMLAKEIEGFLVSTDEGVLRWGRVFGVKEMSAPVFGKKMIE